MNSSLWHEDFTDTYDGRYFIMRLNPHTRITPDYLVDQIFLHLNKKLDFKIFLYHQDYFVLNSNLLRSILTLRRVSSSMGNHSGMHFSLDVLPPELTEDHVLTSAYVKFFRTVTKNAVNKSV